jgi:hypothetical protein
VKNPGVHQVWEKKEYRAPQETKEHVGPWEEKHIRGLPEKRQHGAPVIKKKGFQRKTMVKYAGTLSCQQ